MKKLLLPFTFIFISVSFQIQAQQSIRGRVMDTFDYPVAFANVLLLNPADSSLVKGNVTDEDGYYMLSGINQGEYMLESYMVGYAKTHVYPVNIVRGQDLKLEYIVLPEETRELEGVIIKAEKPLYEMEMGKMVVNVKSSITAAGQSVIDVLEKSPGVAVDRQNNSFALNGKGGVIVLINGKRNRMPIQAVYQLLEGLNASDVEKIEVMTVPPSNYDADGDAGMINIVMKKEIDDGTNGSFMVNGGYATGPMGGGSLNVNHKSGKLSLFGNYSFNYVDQVQEMNFYRKTQGVSEESANNTEWYREATRKTHNFQFGFDYAIGKKTIISGLLGGYNNKWDMDAIGDINYMYSVSPDTFLIMSIYEINHWKHLMGNVNLNHQFEKGQTLNINLDYLTYDNSNPTDYFNNYLDDSGQSYDIREMKISKITPIGIWVASADYSMDIGSSVKFEAGIKGAFTDLLNDVVYEEKNEEGNWVQGDKFSSYSDLDENILAAYSSVQIKFDQKTSMNAGLRYEYTDTYLTDFDGTPVLDRNYGNLFPTLFISRKLNDNSSLQLSYGRRITRPEFNQMAPWVIFIDPYSLMAGNINILPTFTNNIKADYSYKSYIFSVQYSHDENVISRFQPRYDPETNILLTVTENLDRQETISTNIIFPFQITSWWEMQNNVNGNWQMIVHDTDEISYKRDLFMFGLNSTQTFKLPKKFTVELTGFYRSPFILGYQNILSRGMVNFGIQKELAENATLKFSCNDIFETGYILRMRSAIDNQGLEYTADLRFQRRIFTLTYTQKFGKSNVKGARKRSGGSVEERNRVGN